MSDWSWWQDKLAGRPVEMNPGNPHAGFYRSTRKEHYGARKIFMPVAYWPGADGQLCCRIGDEDVTPERGQELWDSVGHQPVSEKAYREVAEHGGMWPDEHELVPMGGHNRPPPDDNSFEALFERTADLAREAKIRTDGPPIQDQDEADRIANLADRLSELWTRIDEVRKQEKRPFDEGAAQVQKKWLPLLTMAESYRNLKYRLLTPWMNKVKAAAKFQAEQAAAEGEPPPPQKRPRAGTRGKAMTLRTRQYAEIIDYKLCLAFFADSPDVRATVQELANRAVRTGAAVPGTKVIEETQAV